MPIGHVMEMQLGPDVDNIMTLIFGPTRKEPDLNLELCLDTVSDLNV